MTLVRNIALTFIVAAIIATSADAGTSARLPAPLAVDCGSGVSGVGFIAYACGDGDGGTKYSRPSELLVLRANGSYKGYRDLISEPDLRARSTTGEVVAAYNDALVRVTSSALKTLASSRELDRLFSGSSHLAAINKVSVAASGAVLFRANYYAGDRHGCGNVLGELTSAGRLKVLARSAAGLICG